MTEPASAPEIPQPEIKVRVNAELNIEVEFNIVQYFKELTADDRTRGQYWGLSSTEWGFDHEWERPIAWLTQEVSEAYETTGMFGYPKGSAIRDHTGDIDFSGDTVEERNGVYTKYENRYWTEEDFEVLIAAVPWLGKPPEAEAAVVQSLPLFSTDVVTRSAGG